MTTTKSKLPKGFKPYYEPRLMAFAPREEFPGALETVHEYSAYDLITVAELAANYPDCQLHIDHMGAYGRYESCEYTIKVMRPKPGKPNPNYEKECVDYARKKAAFEKAKAEYDANMKIWQAEETERLLKDAEKLLRKAGRLK